MSQTDEGTARFWRRLFVGYLCASVVLFLILGFGYLVERSKREQAEFDLDVLPALQKLNMPERERLKAEIAGLRDELEQTKRELKQAKEK